MTMVNENCLVGEKKKKGVFEVGERSFLGGGVGVWVFFWLGVGFGGGGGGGGRGEEGIFFFVFWRGEKE